MARRNLPVVESRVAVRHGVPPRPEDFTPGPLVDASGRRYTYLRLSVTDRCDLACVYCMPPGGELDHALRRDLLSFEEAARVVAVFARGGISRVRFTGGEPLVRKDVVRLIALVHEQTGIDDLVLTTNATRLSELAGDLRRAGLSGVNVSIDTLDATRFRDVTRGGELGPVLAGIRAAIDAGFEVKLNTVAMRGVNDDEIERIVDFAWDLGITPRFIELMPIGEGAHLPGEMFVSADEIVRRLEHKLALGARAPVEGRGPARYHAARDDAARGVGFITAVSDDFCGSCNRVRVTAQGDIRACLASRRAVSLRDIVRSGGTDDDLAWATRWALSGKDVGHHFLDQAVDEHSRVGMSLIGG